MKYTRFLVKNFKGIKETHISLSSVAGASVFAFVGLNESGKTTILEAIHSFAPDKATGEILGSSDAVGVPFEARVPRHQIANFTGKVEVEATLATASEEIDEIIEQVKYEVNLELDPGCLEKEVVFNRSQHFVNGDFNKSFFTLKNKLRVRKDKRAKFREAELSELTKIRDIVFRHAPNIAYFPTFVFDFPDKIFLTDRGNEKDKFYRTVVQDILDYDNRGATIEKDIVRRIREDELIVPFPQFLGLWISRRSEKDKIQQVMDRAGAAVTRLVFGRWNTIFREATSGKEIILDWDIEEGQKITPSGTKTTTSEHDVWVKFQIKDGTRRFEVNNRSLGFRWFFAFMLFTQFRVARNNGKSILFLFDEPASNLHAAAQQKLIESFPEIATKDHALIYTTHSHYMIEPKWLEQTYIVTNRADTPSNSVLQEASMDDESLDVKIQTYRSFVNEHPTSTSYLQPILDRLQVIPSKFDAMKDSVIVEGKSDYYILRYAQKIIACDDLCLVPAFGADSIGPLVSLHKGWGLNYIFLLDGDKKGLEAKKKYEKDYNLQRFRIILLNEVFDEFNCIEDLLDDADKALITERTGSSAFTKSLALRFFQEKLASNDIFAMSERFREGAAKILETLSMRLISSIEF